MLLCRCHIPRGKSAPGDYLMPLEIASLLKCLSLIALDGILAAKRRLRGEFMPPGERLRGRSYTGIQALAFSTPLPSP